MAQRLLADLTSEAQHALFSPAGVMQDQRHIRMFIGGPEHPLHQALFIQTLEVQETINSDRPLRLSALCVSTRKGVASQMLVGQSIEVQVLNDQGHWRSFMALITQATPGSSDGALCAWHIVAVDALSLLWGSSNCRLFQGLSVADISTLMLGEWRQRSGALAEAFEFDTSVLRSERYPSRQFTLQWNESDAAFLIRLWRKSGISWVIRPGHAKAAAEASQAGAPCHTLVLFDEGMALPANAASPLRYHHDGLTVGRNAVTLWSPVRAMAPARTEAASWDYKALRSTDSVALSSADLGDAGHDLAHVLLDYRIDPPHWGDNPQDQERLTGLRSQRQAFEAAQVHGASGARDLAPGTWVVVQNLPEHDASQPELAEHIIASVRHVAQNNLPKALDDRLGDLFAASGWQGLSLQVGLASDQRRYDNTFTAVHRHTPVVPAFAPAVHWPSLQPIHARVVGPQGQEVHCDETGRIKVQIQGLRPEDHAHAQGAGTSNTDRDSAWLRLASPWASAGFGHLSLPRVGDEVIVSFIHGDPDKPLITGTVYSPLQQPPRFENQGALPGNKYLSGQVGKEVFGQRTSSSLMDCTPDQIGLRQSTDHQATQHNLGYLVAPRQDGQGRPRGEGLESRTDAAAALRAAQGILLSAWARLQGSGNQLDYQEALGLMEEGLALFKSMGDYAAQHQGQTLDAGPQSDLKALAKAWQAGTNTQPEADKQDTALIAITAPQGMAHSTPKGISTFAGQNIDTVAQQHIQQVAGQRHTTNAGQGIRQFAHAGGIQHIAHQGDYTVQSQHASTQVDSAQNITLRAVGEITLMGQTITAIAHDGSFIKIGGGITQGTNGSISLHSSNYGHSGPQTMGTSKPQFSKGQPDGQFVLRYGDHTDPGSLIAPNKPYEIKLSDGSVVKGVSDAQGQTSLSLRDAMHIAGVLIGKA